MNPLVLRSNAVPLYRLLSTVVDGIEPDAQPRSTRVLDCGAGGPLPPLSVFEAQGLEAWGIDVSDAQLKQARAFCEAESLDLHLHRGDMRRVLKPDGLCFLGLISAETWPPLGQEREPGEFWVEEGEEATRHSVFTDTEADRLMTGWQIVRKERSATWLASRMESMTEQDWLELYREIWPGGTEDAWLARYDQRFTEARYVHTFYLLRKLP